MLTLKCGNTPTLHRALNVHPQIPIAVTVNDKGDISVGHPSHNNGGYRNVTTPLKEITDALTAHGLKMMPFRTDYGELYINLHPTIPFSIIEGEDGNKTRLCYPTHNNGGDKLNCRCSLVEKAADVSFSWYYERM